MKRKREKRRVYTFYPDVFLCLKISPIRYLCITDNQKETSGVFKNLRLADELYSRTRIQTI